MPVLRCCDCVCNEVWYNPHKVAKPSDGGVSTMSLESIHTLTWSPNASDLDTVCTSHQPGAFRQSGHNPVSTSLERISACMCDHEVSNLIIDGTESQQRKYNASRHTVKEQRLRGLNMSKEIWNRYNNSLYYYSTCQKKNAIEISYTNQTNDNNTEQGKRQGSSGVKLGIDCLPMLFLHLLSLVKSGESCAVPHRWR